MYPRALLSPEPDTLPPYPPPLPQLDMTWTLAAHWEAAAPGRVTTVLYEDLVAHPEAVIREVMDACGLDFEPGVLRFQDAAKGRAVHTASQAQVGVGGVRLRGMASKRRIQGPQPGRVERTYVWIPGTGPGCGARVHHARPSLPGRSILTATP